MKPIGEIKGRFINAVRVGWFLALRQIRRGGKGTTILIISIIVITYLNLVVVSGLLRGLITGSFQQFRESYSGEVIVTSAPGREYIENSQALVGFLKNHPWVTAISPRIGVGVRIHGTLGDLPGKNERPNRISIRLTGINLADEEKVTEFSRFIRYGEMLQDNEDGYLLIGANMLKKYSSFADANIPGLDLLEGAFSNQ